jgi:hypothetical protein
MMKRCFLLEAGEIALKEKQKQHLLLSVRILYLPFISWKDSDNFIYQFRDYGRRGFAALTMRQPFIRKSWH